MVVSTNTPDIICVSETCLSVDILDSEVSLPEETFPLSWITSKINYIYFLLYRQYGKTTSSLP